MQLDVVQAKSLNEMNRITETFVDNNFNIKEDGKNFILLKKRMYGNYYVHILFLCIALFVFNLAIIVNIVYLAISLIWRSPFVLVTTETTDQDGNLLEFTSVDEVIKKGNALF